MAQQKIIITGDARQYEAEARRAERANKRLDNSLKEVGATGRKSTSLLNKGFNSAVNRLQSLITNLGGLTAAIRVAQNVFQKLSDLEKQAGQRALSSEQSKRRLSQVADEEPKEFKRLINLSERVQRGEGITAAAANALVFGAQSAGVSSQEQLELFASLNNIAFSPVAGVGAAVKLRSNFGGEAGAGSVRQILNKLLAASKSSQVDAESIAREAATAAQAFANIGGGDEALLALLATLTNPKKSTSAAAEGLKSLFAQINKRRERIDSDLQGFPLVRALPQLAKEGRLLDEQGRPVGVNKFLSEQLAVDALTSILNAGSKIDRLIGNISLAQAETGTSRDRLAAAIALTEGQPDLVAARERRKAERSLQLSEQRVLGTAFNASSALIAREREGVLLRGGSFLALMRAAQLEFARFFGGSEIVPQLVANPGTGGADFFATVGLGSVSRLFGGGNGGEEDERVDRFERAVERGTAKGMQTSPAGLVRIGEDR